ncbi:MAG: [LysW]-lysine hydrolase [Planctomycetes bacterium]|nr:[LysW]-lysine hydrolase [Planctomycetota bacterium]
MLNSACRLPLSDDDAIRLLEWAVAVPSLSGQEQDCAAVLASAMARCGMRAGIDEAGNAVGILGDGPIDIVLLGHMDTVPGLVPQRREGDLLYGRGTVDAKGPLCAFIAAASRAELPAGVRLIVIGATEEECATSRGARHAAATYRPAACIIGEPSHWDGVTLGYKGRILVTFTARREVAHTAGPDGSAADAVLGVVHEFQSRVSAVPVKPGSTQSSAGAKAGAFDSIQCTVRSMETRSDGFTDEARVVVGLRLSPGVQPSEIAELARAAAEGRDVVVTTAGEETAVVADRSNLVARSLSNAIRDHGGTPTPKRKTGTSDMNVVNPVWNCPIAAYGPGDSALDHTPNEHISLSEYCKSISVLQGAIEAMGRELVGARPAAEVAGGKRG